MAQQYNQPERELGWDEQLTEDAKEVIVIPDGFYQFTVTNYERGRHTPNPNNPGKLPACNKAIISLKIVTAQGESNLKHNLFLHSSTEGMLSAFFGAIGQKQKGVPLNMNWNMVIGSSGVCRVSSKMYNGNKFNEVKQMVYVEDVDQSKVLNAGMVQSHQPYQQQTTYQQAPVYQQPVQQVPQQPQGNYTNGAF